jgi:hypothetical protein
MLDLAGLAVVRLSVIVLAEIYHSIGM